MRAEAVTDSAESLTGDDCARRGRQIGSVGFDRVGAGWLGFLQDLSFLRPTPFCISPFCISKPASIVL